ncbi:MAG: hypothetical protein IPJ07_18145 [Acidobacteria bacterium]|nr:hypothetical protein [Acidobacteriota bacterium]
MLKSSWKRFGSLPSLNPLPNAEASLTFFTFFTVLTLEPFAYDVLDLSRTIFAFHRVEASRSEA